VTTWHTHAGWSGPGWLRRRDLWSHKVGTIRFEFSLSLKQLEQRSGKRSCSMTDPADHSLGVLLYGVVDVRLQSEAAHEAVVAYGDGEGTKLVRLSLDRFEAQGVKGDRKARAARLRAPYVAAPGVPVSLELLPALLQSQRFHAIVEQALCGALVGSAASEVVESLKSDVGGRRLSPIEVQLIDSVSKHPSAEVRLGSLHVAWSALPPLDANVLTGALDSSDVCSVACLVLAQLLLWSAGLQPIVLSTRALMACPVAAPSDWEASVTGELPRR
jgi:hypothetical protein